MTVSNGGLKCPSGQIFKTPARDTVRLLAVVFIDTLRGTEYSEVAGSPNYSGTSDKGPSEKGTTSHKGHFIMSQK